MPGGLSALTPRELDILRQMANGLSCREIAGALALSASTVKTHRRNMLGKLGMCSAAQAIELARREDLLPRLASSAPPDTLSRREMQVMALVIRGLTSKQIARDLGIQDATARKHRENLLRKLGLRSIAQLVARHG